MVKILRPLLRLLSIAGVWLGIADSCVIAQELSLFDLVKNGDVEAVEQLLKSRIDVNIDEPDGATALHWAAYWSDRDTLDLLIAAGSSVDAQNDYGATPLWAACANRHGGIVERLLEAGANPNLRLRSGETLLMRCVHTGDAAAVRALVAHGADHLGELVAADVRPAAAGRVRLGAYRCDVVPGLIARRGAVHVALRPGAASGPR